MRFMIIGRATKESEAGVLPKPEAFAAMQEYNEQLVKAGVLLAAEGLSASSKGACSPGSCRGMTGMPARIRSSTQRVDRPSSLASCLFVSSRCGLVGNRTTTAGL